MARRPRIDLAGYHHIINRGVNRTDVFNDSGDKEMFLKILCKSLKSYNAILHSYCLMDNHYHLLIETTQENLSLLMRNINVCTNCFDTSNSPLRAKVVKNFAQS